MAVKVILNPQLIFFLPSIVGIQTVGRVSEKRPTLTASLTSASTQVEPPSVVFSIII